MKPPTITGNGCCQCGADPIDSIFVAKAPHLFCKECMPVGTTDPTLDEMVNAALCSIDPVVIRAASDKFIARHNIPLSRINLPPIERGTGDFYTTKPNKEAA